MEKFKNIAVLIDADNAQLARLESVLEEVSRYGHIALKRAYGNWKKDILKNWESELLRLAIKAVQQYDYVPGKNATDMALVIDAVELLHTGVYDAFVIVASDSDYTPLAIHLREAGAYVIGIGSSVATNSFKTSCDEFIMPGEIKNVVEPVAKARVLVSVRAAEKTVPALPPVPVTETMNSFAVTKNPEIVHNYLKAVSRMHNGEFVDMDTVGKYIKQVNPNFNIKSFGYQNLSKFVRAFPERYVVSSYQGKGGVLIYIYRCK